MRAGLLPVVTVLGCCLSAACAQKGDALDEALALVGMRRADLGWTPKGWWPRYPDVPYKLRAFDALFAEPLDTITYTRALGQTAWDKLDPAELDKEQGRGSRNLFQAVQRLGIDPRFGGFRGYTANVLAPEVPLDEAILKLTEAAHRPTRISTFGMELPYPTPKEDLAEMVARLPEGVSPILGQLVLNIIDAHYWAELAFRKVDGNDRIVVATRYNVGEELVDAFDYCPQMDDLARSWDEACLWYAGQKCVQALDDARVKLAELKLRNVPKFAFDWESPWGWIRIRGGGDDRVDGTNALLIVDLGGDDRYQGGVAASTAERPIGLLLDLRGDDRYTSVQPAQGAGLCGVGVLIDAAGDDRYKARHYAQGVGQFGLGLCADLAGDDTYFNKYSGQGCGYFGIGLLFDVSGQDQYVLYADGQGFGGNGGVGVLADRSGADCYTAIREHSVTGRPSYHSRDLDVGVSNCQGCGMGRRGDGADGHSWAGGLGALLDGEGDDYYTAGNWSMGTGYWFGIGVLHDRGGNDEYHGVVYSQGTGAHFCIGVMVDEAGDDKHLAEENSNSSLAWAHDFTIGILLDVSGDDLYSVDTSGLAYSINRSIALLIDTSGNDVYKTDLEQRKEKEQGLLPGTAINKENFRARGGVSTYFADTASLALFLDVGGSDTYWGDIQNNTHWLDPSDSPNWADRNFSIGVDRAEGTIDFTPTPVKQPSGRKM
ncbi:MAG: hypothetical protein KAY37_06285 [Phycisphaerae bacterium]|nr:hypothetical protein [Phycisphaerae bacterium]